MKYLKLISHKSLLTFNKPEICYDFTMLPTLIPFIHETSLCFSIDWKQKKIKIVPDLLQHWKCTVRVNGFSFGNLFTVMNVNIHKPAFECIHETPA